MKRSELRILFIGGTGTIGSACVPGVLAAGHRLAVVSRGITASSAAVPAGVEVLRLDVRDQAAVRSAIGGREFDVVVNFAGYTADQVEFDAELFAGRIGQYVFVSSAAVYQKPPRRVPVNESTPLVNPFWQYAQDKIACEHALQTANRERGFPVTIVRPANTYDRTRVPILGGWTQVERMRRGLPVIVHGDGTSLWTLTHSVDFAGGLVGLLGNPRAVGEAYTVAGDDVLTWNQIFETLGQAAGVAQPRLVHVTSDRIAAVVPDWGPGLLGARSHSMILDTSKARATVPAFRTSVLFEQGAREIVAWRDEDPARRGVDVGVDAAIEEVLAGVR